MPLFLTPVLGFLSKFKVYIVIGLIVLAAGAIYLEGKRDQKSIDQPKIERALDQADISGLETSGAQESAQRVEVFVRQTHDAYAVTSRLAVEATKAEDAHAPLDPSRAARLRSTDRELCDTRPSLVGCQPANPNAH